MNLFTISAVITGALGVMLLAAGIFWHLDLWFDMIAGLCIVASGMLTFFAITYKQESVPGMVTNIHAILS